MPPVPVELLQPHQFMASPAGEDGRYRLPGNAARGRSHAVPAGLAHPRMQAMRGAGFVVALPHEADRDRLTLPVSNEPARHVC